MSKHDDFIPVSNSFFRDEDEKLSPRDLYLYSYLYSRRNYFSVSSTQTNLGLIMSEVKFVKKKQDNKKYVLDSLKSLQDKGIIFFDAEEIGLDTLLVITFKFFEKGYEKIPHKLLRMTSDPEEYMILCYVKKAKRSISFSEFAKILGCSESHVKSVIADMETNLLLNVEHGRHYINENGEIRQDKNSYQVNGSSRIPDQHDFDSTDNNVDEEDDLENEVIQHNWYDFNANLDVDDMILYLTTEDEKLKKAAESRMERIKKTETGKHIIDRLLDEAERILDQEDETDKEKREQAMLMNMAGTPVKMKDGQIVEVDAANVEGIDFIHAVDSVFYLGQVDFVGYEKIDKMLQYRIRGDLFDDGRYYQETIQAVIGKLKEYIGQQKLTKTMLDRLSVCFRDIVSKNNEGKDPDTEALEGDRYWGLPYGDDYEEENLSLNERKQQKRYREQRGKEIEEEERKAKFYTSFFD